jgi:hypothetical protein
MKISGLSEMPIAASPLAKHPVGKSDDSNAQFAIQVHFVVFEGDVPFDKLRVNSGQRGANLSSQRKRPSPSLYGIQSVPKRSQQIDPA